METIARYDNPSLIGKNGVRDYYAQKSYYSSIRTVSMAFEDLIKNANFKYIFVSYNNEGLMSPNEIKNIMSRYGKYQYFIKEYRRFNLKRGLLKPQYVLEYLHCLKK